MKVLMISGVFYPKINGNAVAVSNMMKSLVDRGHTVVLVTRRERGAPEVERWRGAEVIRVGRPGFSLFARASLALAQFSAAFRTSRHEPPDVIHVHGFAALLAGAALGMVRRRPVVVSFHGIHRLWSAGARWRGTTTLGMTLPFEKALLRFPSVVLAQSRLLKEVIARTYDVEPARIEVIPNPIDVGAFSYAEPADGDRPVVLFVGSFMKVHGPDLLIGSLPLIRGKSPGVRMLLVGRGPLKGALEQEVRELGAEESVEIAEEVRDQKLLSRIYQGSRVVVLPLRYAGYIMSLVGEEAMASGRPVVTTMTLDSELADAGVVLTGSAGLGESVSRVLGWDEGTYLAASRAAREYAERNYSAEAVGMRLEGVYERAVRGKQRGGAGRAGV